MRELQNKLLGHGLMGGKNKKKPRPEYEARMSPVKGVVQRKSADLAAKQEGKVHDTGSLPRRVDQLGRLFPRKLYAGRDWERP